MATISLGHDQTQLGGFFSQGYLYSSNNNYPTANRGGTWDFREMAVNVSTTYGSHLRLGAQAFAQRFGALGDDTAVYAGHDYGDVTVSSLGRERQRNPYFQLHDVDDFVRFRMRPRT